MVSVEDYEQSGHPEVATTDENIQLVHSLIMCDSRSLHENARQIHISFQAVLSILTDLGMSTVSARWVPRMLTKDQNKSRIDTSKYLLSLYGDDPEEFMHQQTWVHHFDPKAKRQSMQWKHPGSSTPKKFMSFFSRVGDGAVSGDCEEKKRKVDSRCSTLAT